jgi:hypoxanthine phosphoribosyltransferase
VLIVDDICTEGFTLEAARAFVAQTGASSIGLAWLKTINTGYKELVMPPRFNAYIAQGFPVTQTREEHRYRRHVIDDNASTELDAKLRAYKSWSW